MKKKNILRLVPGSQELVLKALDGNRLIRRGVFPGLCLRAKDKRLLLTKNGTPTPETPINVHEMVADGTLMEVFRSLPGTWSQKWLSHDQIIEFCQSLPEWLRQENGSTIFLAKKDESRPINEKSPAADLHLFVVSIDEKGLSVFVNCLKGDIAAVSWRDINIVSPQLPSGA